MKKAAWILVLTLLLTLFTACGKKNTAGYSTPEKAFWAYLEGCNNVDYDRYISAVHPNMREDYIEMWEDKEDADSAEAVRFTDIEYQILDIWDTPITPAEEAPNYYNGQVYADEYAYADVYFTEHKTLAFRATAFDREKLEDVSYDKKVYLFCSEGRWYIDISPMS